MIYLTPTTPYHHAWLRVATSCHMTNLKRLVMMWALAALGHCGTHQGIADEPSVSPTKIVVFDTLRLIFRSYWFFSGKAGPLVRTGGPASF